MVRLLVPKKKNNNNNSREKKAHARKPERSHRPRTQLHYVLILLLQLAMRRFTEMIRKNFLSNMKRNTFVSILALSILVLASPIAVSAYTPNTHMAPASSTSQVRVGASGVFASSLPKNVLNAMLSSERSRSGGASGPAHSSIPKQICSIPSGDIASGIYAAGKGAAYVEDWDYGNLYYCKGGTATLVASAPTGFSSYGYYAMSGVKTSTGLDILLISWELKAGWVCVGASASGCSGGQLPFSLPATFCASEVTGSCTPDGVVATKSLGFTYVDVNNEQLVTCKPLASSCKVDAASSAFSGYLPVGLTKYKGVYYVSDQSCTGNMWAGTKSSMALSASMGDELEGIAVSHHNVGKNPELYVADTGFCTSTPASIVDVTDGGSVPTVASSSTEIIGISSGLQFTLSDYGQAYQTADTS
jgi:hypothetical protein